MSNKHLPHDLEQIGIFDVLWDDGRFEKTAVPKKLKMISLFSGIGAFEKALANLGIQFELVGYCEINRYASKSYSAIHNIPESMNLWDVTKINTKALPKYTDLLTYGFPCQDISIAGQQKGLFNEDGTQTRSGLFFEALRVIEETQPRVAIAENVKNLTSNRFKEQFATVLDALEQAGYNNYWAVLNAKNYKIPQNRERVIIVSIRKDIDPGTFKFPAGVPLGKRLKDVLEDEVDEKYFLSPSQIKNAHLKLDNLAVGKSEPCVRQIGNLMPSKTRDNPNQGRLYDKEGIAPTLGAMQGENRQPFIIDDTKSVSQIHRRKCLHTMGMLKGT